MNHYQPTDNEDEVLLASRTSPAPDHPNALLFFHLIQDRESPSHPEPRTDFLHPGEIWYQVWSNIRSAGWHLDRYLDTLAESRETLDDMPAATQELSTTTQSERYRRRLQIRMDICRDMTIRDLLAVETVLAYAKNLRKDQKPTYSGAGAIRIAIYVIRAWATTNRHTRLFFAALAIGEAAFFAARPAWHFYHNYRLDVARAIVLELRRNFQHNTGVINRECVEVLKEERFEFIKRMFQPKFLYEIKRDLMARESGDSDL